MGAMRDLVPLPRSIDELPGALDLSRGGLVAAAPGLEAQGRLAAAWLAEALGRPFRSAVGEDAGGVRARGGAAGGQAASGPPAGPGGLARADAAGEAAEPPLVELRLDPALSGAEDYVLTIGPEGAAVAAASPEGVVRGLSTLRQLALSEGPVIRSLRIEDGPRFPWRGLMLDCARSFFRVEFIERLLDLAALHKLNVFHWHLTDDQAWRLDLPGLPELAAAGSRRRDSRIHGVAWREGSYSVDDARRVVAYAAERGIMVVPEIETPGHAIALLSSHPELSCAGAAAGGLPFMPEDRFGVFEDILCAGNEGVFELLGRVFDGLAGIFPGPFVHVGGDEAPKARWLLCPKCRGVMRAHNLRGPGGELDPERLQSWFMGRVSALLAERGKRMVGWDEILEGGVAAPGGEGVPKDAVAMSWRGYSGGAEGARAGLEVVMCPQTKACYLDHKHLDLPEEPGNLGVCTVRDSYAFEPVPPGLSPEEAALVKGGQANLWTEMAYFGRQAEYLLFPRLSALSEALWSPKEARCFEDFARRLPAHGRRLDVLGVNRYRGPLY